jgi:hypothetical protein
MKLHGLTRFKNEGDVIEEFVHHNLRFLDALTVIDNASFDGTFSVLESLRAEGLPLTIQHDPIMPKRQSETMTRAARQCAAEADWDFLFLLDADEFLKVGDRDGLEQSLAAVAPDENGPLPWVSYVPTKRDDESEPRILNRITYRRVVESTPVFYKSVISRGFAQRGAFSIAQGNHNTRDANGEAPAVVLHHAALAHFPVSQPRPDSKQSAAGMGRLYRNGSRRRIRVAPAPSLPKARIRFGVDLGRSLRNRAFVYRRGGIASRSDGDARSVAARPRLAIREHRRRDLAGVGCHVRSATRPRGRGVRSYRTEAAASCHRPVSTSLCASMSLSRACSKPASRMESG